MPDAGKDIRAAVTELIVGTLGHFRPYIEGSPAFHGNCVTGLLLRV